MTDEQINWAITEAIGADPHWKCAKDYCTDLNAINEAENVLDTIEQGYYWDHLKDLTDEGFDQLHATARKRAEAFLRALGKWEEVHG